MLRLLDAERLNVSELTGILGIAQSGVSRHLGLLKDAGLVVEDRDGGFSFYRIAPAVREGQNGFGPVWPLLQSQFATLEGLEPDEPGITVDVTDPPERIVAKVVDDPAP